MRRRVKRRKMRRLGSWLGSFCVKDKVLVFKSCSRIFLPFTESGDVLPDSCGNVWVTNLDFHAVSAQCIWAMEVP